MSKTQPPSDNPAPPPVRTRTRPVPRIAHASPPLAPPDEEVPQAPVRQRKRAASEPAPPPSAPESDDYKVGYGKPPRHSQFKPGPDPRRPRGRKPGAKNKGNAIVDMMESPIVVRTPDGDTKTIATSEAMARKLRELSLAGNLAAIIKAFELYLKAVPPAAVAAEAQEHGQPEPAAEATDMAILSWYEDEVLSRSKNGKADK